MSIQPDRPLIDALRAALQKAEADPAAETKTIRDLKRILRERIATLEAIARNGDTR